MANKTNSAEMDAALAAARSRFSAPPGDMTSGCSSPPPFSSVAQNSNTRYTKAPEHYMSVNPNNAHVVVMPRASPDRESRTVHQVHPFGMRDSGNGGSTNSSNQSLPHDIQTLNETQVLKHLSKHAAAVHDQQQHIYGASSQPVLSSQLAQGLGPTSFTVQDPHTSAQFSSQQLLHTTMSPPPPTFDLSTPPPPYPLGYQQQQVPKLMRQQSPAADLSRLAAAMPPNVFLPAHSATVQQQQQGSVMSLSNPDIMRLLEHTIASSSSHNLGSSPQKSRSGVSRQVQRGATTVLVDGDHNSNHLLPQMDLPAESVLDVGGTHGQNLIKCLVEDNQKLRVQCEQYLKKACRLQQLELQYQKVHREYEDLVRRHEKRDALEKEVRNRLQDEIHRLKERNQELRSQLDQIYGELQRREEQDDGVELRMELTQKNYLITDLMAKHQELDAIAERQHIELEAQRLTLEEQRNHIQILDKALANQQDRCQSLVEQLNEKVQCESRCQQLERALQTLREAAGKSEESNKKIRAQLEQKLAQLQLQKTKESTSSMRQARVESDSAIVSKLQQELERMEAELQSARAEAAVLRCDHSHSPKEDRKSLDDDRKCSTITTDARRFSEDVLQASRRIAELETKVDTLEERLAQKDAMITVLRRHSLEPSSDVAGLWPTDYNSLDKTRLRLEAVKRRLVQPRSDSPSLARRLMKSMDATASDTEATLAPSPGMRRYVRNLDSIASHARTHSTSESPLISYRDRVVGVADFTFPAARRINGRGGAEGRPKSADDHMLAATGGTSGGGETKQTTQIEITEQPEPAGDSSKAESSEQLWDV